MSAWLAKWQLFMFSGIAWQQLYIIGGKVGLYICLAANTSGLLSRAMCRYGS